jgi:hypothetical protein
MESTTSALRHRGNAQQPNRQSRRRQATLISTFRASAPSLIVAILAACSSVHVLEKPPVAKGRAFPGEEFTQGILCTNPFVAKDLIDVINDETMYRSWLKGYVVSGYCSEWNAGNFRLLRKLTFENTSFDGYHAELWEVRVPLAERAVTLYGIVFPDALNTLGGLRP